MNTNIKPYLLLMRLNKPIGIFLLLWPTLWALWLASAGHPDMTIVSIFILGVIFMRSAGCIINDIADRHVDQYVERTRLRPLATGEITVKSAFILFFLLLLCAFCLVLLLNPLTIGLAFVGALLAIIYPFLKRITHLPQFGLGLAFAWGVPMAYAALTHTTPVECWILFAAAAIWPVIYDTFYAMVDKKDDVTAGVKSTAILFGRHTALIIGLLQIIFILLLILLGRQYQLNIYYYLSLLITAFLFLYQQYLIKSGVRERYFQAFLNNNWVGMILFLGLLLGLTP